MGIIKKLAAVFSYSKPRKVAITSAAFYMLIYLFLIGDLIYSSSQLASDTPSLQIAEDWPSRLLKEKVSFNYEAIAAVYFTNNFAFLISLPNLLLGAVLSTMIGLNIGFLAFALEKPKVCGSKSYDGILSSLPTLFMGFTCCAPTILITLGSAAASLTLGFIALRSVFYPVAFIGLLISLWFNLNKVELGRSK